MILRRQKSARAAISLLLALFIAPGYALGNLTGSDADANPKTVTPAPKRQLSARLAVRGTHPALINGNGSYTGATVLSGSTIQTPGGVRATVQLGRLGSLDLSPNTVAVINFSNDSVTGKLRKGCATLSANKDVNGVLMTPEGESLSTEKMGVSSITTCSANAANAAMPVAGAGGGGGNNTPKNSQGKPGFLGLNPNSTLALMSAGGFAASGIINHSAASNYGKDAPYRMMDDPYVRDDRKKKDHFGKDDPRKKDHGKKDHFWDKKDHGKKDHGYGGGIAINNNNNNANSNSNSNTNNNTNNVTVRVCVVTNSLSPSSPGC